MTTLHKLLALHYAYPLTLNKLHYLLRNIQTLNELETVSVSNLAQMINIKQETAYTLKRTYVSLCQTDLLEFYASKDIEIIPYTSDLYPTQLFQLSDPPAVLYCKGDSNLLTAQNKIACIGSREATAYSAEAFKQIIPPLIQHHYVIVSGLAKGADTLAHRAAVHYGGKTIAVLGHGLQTIYPRSNEQLANHLSKHHLLVTEYPPHVGAKKHHFPMRNRIISGLSNALVVTEAALRSGTLITTELALEQGKDVFAVPGPITSLQSAGTNNLIREGAIPIWNGYQIIEELQMFQMKN
ncbi:DNA-processing protein DprA [Lysinibacillus sp. LZ02]|uniref:DNA-processing protein DprA n=1 Tax=Lysinibacillus sp. LZ02 TaxID=3420668 RepID=UPI003D36370B